ncbi:UNVERIFIED_CONTAM: oligopeptide/dipeptide ABC transporter ATP-binding protein [Brevibacillus sp. OAP136]
MTTPILEIKGLKKRFANKSGWLQKPTFVHALNGIDLRVFEGETVGIVGESGCGKSTLGRCILRLIEPSEGTILFEGKNISELDKKEMVHVRRHMQMVFQNPYDTLNPKQTIRNILKEPLVAHRVPQEEHDSLLAETIEAVGLTVRHLSRYPHEFSGGQRQRIGIARALMLRPKVIIADEPVSALDVSIQAQILNLLQDLQEQYCLTYLFISHDLSVVEHISDKVAVLYLGEMVEFGEKEKLFGQPLHPYTQALLSSVPIADPDEQRERITLRGDLPSPSNPPDGCKFHPRCHACLNICRTEAPPMREVEGRMIACHLYR